MIYILMLLTYWHMGVHGITEGMATQGKQFTSKPYQDRYHWKRLLEQAPIILAVILFLILLGKAYLIPAFIVTCLSALGLYEMTFSKEKYGSYLHTKTSKWLGIQHPPGWVNLAAFISCGILAFILI